MAKNKTGKGKDFTFDIIMSEYNKAAGMTVVGPLAAFDLSLEAIPTGNLMLDVATGIGGFALGKMYEVAGDKASGKSTLCISLARQHLLRTDKKILYIDIEDSSTSTLLDNFGLYDGDYNLRFFRSSMAIAETVLDLVIDFVKLGEFSLVIIDSVAALIPQSEYDKNLDDSEQIGERAKLVQRFIQKINPILGATKTTMVLINQLRTNIKLAQINPRVNPMKSTGGKAVEYFPSFKVTLQTKNAGKDKRYFDDIGVKLAEPVQSIVGKNKLARTCDFGKPSTLRLGFGFDPIYDLIDLAELAYQIKYRGSWIYIGDDMKFQGSVKLYNALLEDTNVLNALIDNTLPLVGIKDVDFYRPVFEDFIERKKSKYDKNMFNFSINVDNNE